jgi:PAS domain S-box-containing protein
MLSILYVDDEPGLLDIGKIFLERSGELSVDTAISAKDAITKINMSEYDCIVSDYQMPGMDGLSFLKYIRDTWGPLPFILFTGKGREEVVIEALNNGADFYLQKGGEPKSQFAELKHKIILAAERRKVNERLKNSERRLTDIINFLPDAIFAIDLQGKVIAWNRSIEEMTGISQEQILGKGDYIYSYYVFGERKPLLIDLILNDHPDSEKEYQSITRKEDKLITERFIQSLYGGKGAFLWLIASPLYDSDGNVIGAIESLRDITDRKIAEEELKAAFEQLAAAEEELRQQLEDLAGSEQKIRDNERRLSEIINFLPDATFAIDQKGVVIAWNNAMEEMTGVHKTDIIGTGNYSYSLPMWGERRPILIDTVLKEDEEIERIYPSVVRKNGKLIAEVFAPGFYGGKGAYVWFTASPLFDTNGRLAGAIESIRDISEQRKAHDELRAAYQELTATEEELRHQYRDLSWSEERIKEDERFIRNVFSSIMDGIIIMDKDLTIIEVNDALKSDYQDKWPLIGKKCYKVFHQKNTVCDHCPAIKTLKTGFPGQKTILRKDEAGTRSLEVFTYPLYDPQAGKITGVIEYIRGISDKTPHKLTNDTSDSPVKPDDLSNSHT